MCLRADRRWRAACTAAGLLVAGGTLQASTADRVELLALRVNGVEPAGTPAVVTVRRGPGGLALERGTWAALGLREPPAAGDGDAWLNLDAAALAWRIDVPTQTLLIEAPATAFRSRLLTPGSPADEAPVSGRGWFANVETHWLAPGRGLPARGNTWLDLHGFGPYSSWRHGMVVQDSGPRRRALRLETSWQHEDPTRRRTLVLGDTLLQGGSWGRALRIGGLRWSSDFALDPAFVSFPTPTLLGEATLPSTVELYVDGVRRLAQAVEPGPFQVAGLPLPSGQGELRLVVRDLLGREQVLQLPYHTHATLLKPGLVASSLELGFERLGYGRDSGHYGAPVASVTRREGRSEGWTQEWRAEAGQGHLAAGGAATWLWPGVAVLQGQLALSRSADRDGAMLALQAEHSRRDWAASVQLRGHSADFRQLGQPPQAAARWQASAQLGTRWGGLALALNLLHRQDRAGPAQRLGGAQLSHGLGRWGHLGLTLLHERGGAGLLAALNLHVPLGDRQSLAAGWTHRPGRDGRATTGGQLWWQQSPPDGTGLGLRLGLEHARPEGAAAAGRRRSAELLWQGEQADIELGVAHSDGATPLRIGARGAFGWIDGQAFASRRIDGSVAALRVDGGPGIAVRVDRRPVGRTDADGRLVITGLRPHERQRIELDSDDLPADAEARDLARDIVVPGRGGFSLAMALRRERTLQLRLMRADGRAPAVGSRVEVAGREPLPGDVVGFEGRVFLAQLGHATALQLTVHEPGGASCRLSLPAPVMAGADLGEQPCR